VRAEVNLPLSRLKEWMATLDRDRTIVVHCASGYRSSVAASLLRRAGLQDVSDLLGGYKAWSAAQAGEPHDRAAADGFHTAMR